MHYTKEALLFKTENNNNYLFNYKKNEFIFVHPIVNELITLYREKKDIKECKKIISDKSQKNNHSKNDIDYYFKKFLFLLQNGYMNNFVTHISPITEKVIHRSVSDVKHIVFEVTEDCNLKCKYCFYGPLYVEKQSNAKDKNLNIDLAKKNIDHIFNHIIATPPKVFSISIYGGEPLLKFSFIEEIVYYVRNKWSNQKFQFGITTNAVLLKRYMDFLVQNNFNMLISLDGSEYHNIHRTFKNGKPYFKKVFDNVLILKKKILCTLLIR